MQEWLAEVQMSRIFLLMLLVACDGASSDSASTKTTRTAVDNGTACLDDSGQILVIFQECLSSSCDTLVSATCTATLEGDTLVVHAEAVIDSVGVTCTADCGQVSATCAPPLIEDPDTVTLSYAGTEHPLSDPCTGP